jgi:SAM-dependent methyltransferase
MNRACEPELLDSLPHDHPDAIHSRRDLRLINGIMRNRAWFERTLPLVLRPGERVLEIGAGTGEMAAMLIRAGIPVDGLDLCPPPAGWPAGRAWHRADLTTFDGYAAYPAVIGNLIFHHLDGGGLAALGARLRRSARVVAACEPGRSKASQAAVAAVGPLLGANRVTLHDARISIAAGFRDDELPRSLGMTGAGWDVTCSMSALGANRIVAIRRA